MVATSISTPGAITSPLRDLPRCGIITARQVCHAITRRGSRLCGATTDSLIQRTSVLGHGDTARRCCPRPAARQHNTDLLLRRISLARLAPDVLQSPVGRILVTFCSMSHRSLLNSDDEPKILRYAIISICPISADVGQELPTAAGIRAVSANRPKALTLLPLGCAAVRQFSTLLLRAGAG